MRNNKVLRSAGLVVCLALCLVVTSCSGSQEPAASEPPALDQTADPTEAAASDVAEIVVVVQDEPDLVWHSTDFASITITSNLYESLVTRDAAGDLSPLLAESWEQVDDLTWRFHLKQGVIFHDGAPFDANSVAWHIETLSDPEFAGAVTHKFSDNKLSTQVIDDFTIDIITEFPDPILPRLMYWLFMSSPDSQKLDTDSQNMVGTGPYKLDTWDHGESVVLVANPDYWGDEPTVKKVTFIWREDPALRLAMVRAGDADIAQGIVPGDDSSVRILTANISETSFIHLDPNPPLDDIRVRKAICMAFDREVIVDDIFSGYANPATQLVTSDVMGFNPEIPLMTYDPEQARSLIEDAKGDGVPVELELTIIGRNGIHSNATKAMEELQLWLTEIGLKVNLEMLDKPDWKEHINSNPVPEDRRTITQSSHGNEAGDSIFTMGAYYHSDARKTTFPDTTQDDLISAAAPLVGDAREQALSEVLAYQHDNVMQDCPMVHLQAVWGISERVDWEPRFDNMILVMTVSLN